MKDTDVLLLGGLAYLFLRENAATTTDTTGGGGGYAPAPAVLYGGAKVTDADVKQLKKAGVSNADAVNFFAGGSIQVPTSKGGLRTISGPPLGATHTSINGNQYLAPRSGGGSKVVGARNITLNAPKTKRSTQTITVNGKTYAVNQR